MPNSETGDEQRINPTVKRETVHKRAVIPLQKARVHKGGEREQEERRVPLCAACLPISQRGRNTLRRVPPSLPKKGITLCAACLPVSHTQECIPSMPPCLSYPEVYTLHASLPTQRCTPFMPLYLPGWYIPVYTHPYLPGWYIPVYTPPS